MDFGCLDLYFGCLDLYFRCLGLYFGCLDLYFGCLDLYSCATRGPVFLCHKKTCLLVPQEDMSSDATGNQIGAIARLKMRPVFARLREAGFVNRVNIYNRADSKSQSWPIESIGPIGQIDCRAASRVNASSMSATAAAI